MSIKRLQDPAGLLPDTAHVDLTDGDGLEEMVAIMSLLQRATPLARIDRLRRHPELAARAEELTCSAAGRSVEDHVLAEIASLEHRALYMDVASIAVRDRGRQAGTHKPRGNKKPLLDAWLDGQDLSLSNDALFARLPEPDMADDLYRDGTGVVEINRHGKAKYVQRTGFDHRVRSARKRR